MDNLFFDLIKVAVGSRDSISGTPSVVEWNQIFATAEKQSLLGVCFAGVQRLGAGSFDGFARVEMPEELYFNWIGVASQIQDKNETVERQCVELQARLSKAGIGSSILKGQGIAALYDHGLNELRQSGDIDVFVDCGREKAIEYARALQEKVDWDYKHLHLDVFEDTEVEMHYVPEVLLNLRKNRKLQEWFKEHRGEMFVKTGALVTPSLGINLFYILLHAYRHFLYEGVGLRQLMDYYFVLSNPRVTSLMRNDTMAAVRSFGMERFTRGMMWIMQNVFGLADECLICAADEKEGRYILDEVMAGGNFGHYDERLTDDKTTGKMLAIKKILKHNLHLLAHYPGDVLWAPVWFVYHWCWKKLHRI